MFAFMPCSHPLTVHDRCPYVLSFRHRPIRPAAYCDRASQALLLCWRNPDHRPDPAEHFARTIGVLDDATDFLPCFVAVGCAVCSRSSRAAALGHSLRPQRKAGLAETLTRAPREQVRFWGDSAAPTFSTSVSAWRARERRPPGQRRLERRCWRTTHIGIVNRGSVSPPPAGAPQQYRRANQTKTPRGWDGTQRRLGCDRRRCHCSNNIRGKHNSKLRLRRTRRDMRVSSLPPQSGVA